MRYFITGATGFIGNRLAHRLADEGHEIIALNRSPQKASLLEHPGITICPAKLSDKKEILRSLKGCDGIFHLAAIASVWMKDPSDYFRVNVGATLDLLELADQAGVPVMVFTSSAGVMGPSEGTEINEDSWRKVDFFNEYESSKFLAEERFLLKEMPGIRRVVLQPSRVYGPGILSESNAVTRMIIQYSLGKWRIIPGNGKRLGNYVFVDDVIDGHIRAMNRGRDGQRYLLGGENISYEGFFDTVSEISGKKYRLFRIPARIIIFLSAVLLFLGRLRLIRPALTPTWARKYIHDWSLSSQKAMLEIGYQPHSLSEGVRATLAWHAEQSAPDQKHKKGS